MYCLHCKYTTKLRNDKEINALFALYNGVQQSLLHQQSNRAPTLQSSHRMQKTSGARYSPTDCTDVHRLGGYGIPAIPTQPQNYLPTEFTEPTEVSDARYSPTDCTDAHRLGGYGIPAIPTQPPNYLPTEFTHKIFWRRRKICVHLCASVGGPSTPETSVGSACSVGEPCASKPSVRICGRLFYARSFCVFCEFRGRTLRSLTICVHLCASVGGSSPPEASVYSVNFVGEPYAA